MSRHNRRQPNRRRSSSRPQTEPTQVSTGWDFLARELVRRGLAHPSILSSSFSIEPTPKENQP